jgi:hypothetical protein
MLKDKRQKSKGKSQKCGLKLLTFVFYFLLFGFCFLVFSYAQDEFVYDSKGKRNPFIPLVTPDGRFLKLDKEEEKKGDLRVEGIIYDKNGRSFAIVNTSVVGIGDFIGEYRVLKIEQNKVIFIKEDQTLEVGLSVEKEEK